jgi:hypothetical protein
MRSVLFILLIALGIGVAAYAQTKSKPEPVLGAAAAKKYPPVYTYLGNAQLKGGNISKNDFVNYIKQGLKAKDEKGTQYTIINFNLTYGERNLYEDSVGDLKMMTDYQLIKCIGDSVITLMVNDIAERLKEGDTIYFDKIIVNRADSTTTQSKNLKFGITK